MLDDPNVTGRIASYYPNLDKFQPYPDFVNPFNIVRWGNPSTMVGPPTFGQITSTQGSRRVQINMELSF